MACPKLMLYFSYESKIVSSKIPQPSATRISVKDIIRIEIII
jgi:hypothetical protein